MTKGDVEGVLARWSRRKAAARAGAPEAEAAEEERPTTHVDEPERPSALAATDVPDALPELPDPDTLEAPADLKQFLRKGVPPDLRRRALRRLWRLDPAYHRLDGLDDYCEDYTDQARVVKDLRTAYRVGRGFLEELATADRAATPATPEPALEAAAVTTATDGPGDADQAAEPAPEPPAGPERGATSPAAPGHDRAVPGSREREPPRPRSLPRRL